MSNISKKALQEARKANLEVTDAHVSIPRNKEFDTIGHRIEEIESDIPYKPMTNLVKNGDFSEPLEGWEQVGPTVYRSISEGRILLDYDSPSMNNTAIIEYDIGTLKLNDKIYMALDVEHYGEEIPNTTDVYLRGGVPSPIPENMTDGTGKKQRISGVAEINEEPSASVKFAYRDRFKVTAKNSGALIDNIIVINLTDAFGQGNEPTLSEMNELLDDYPNSWFDGTVNFYNLESEINKIKLGSELNESELNKINTLIEEGGVGGMQGLDATTGLPASPSFETDANGYSALRITDATPFAYDELSDRLKVVTDGYDVDSDSIKTTSVNEFHTSPIDIFPQMTRIESPEAVVVEVPKDVKGYMVYAVVNGAITGDVSDGGFKVPVTGQLGTGGSAFQWYTVTHEFVKSGHRNIVIYSYPETLGTDDSTSPTGNSETLFVSKVVPTHLRIMLLIEGIFEVGEGIPISVKLRWLR